MTTQTIAKETAANTQAIEAVQKVLNVAKNYVDENTNLAIYKEIRVVNAHEIVAPMIAISTDEYKTIPFPIRNQLAFVVISEHVNGYNVRFYVLRDISGSYCVLCFYETLHFETIIMDTYGDAMKLICYIDRPSKADLKYLRNSLAK